jgi:hypothetical protein
MFGLIQGFPHQAKTLHAIICVLLREAQGKQGGYRSWQINSFSVPCNLIISLLASWSLVKGSPINLSTAKSSHTPINHWSMHHTSLQIHTYPSPLDPSTKNSRTTTGKSSYNHDIFHPIKWARFLPGFLTQQYFCGLCIWWHNESQVLGFPMIAGALMALVPSLVAAASVWLVLISWW